MAFKADGSWGYEDDSAAGKVAQLTAQDSPLMRQAATSGMKAANRRGLVNSTMGIGAGHSAVLGVATPIASQDSQQTNAKNLAQLGYVRDVDINRSQMAQKDRETQLNSLVTLTGNTQSAISQTLNNSKIPAAVRSNVQSSIADSQTAVLSAMQRLYGNNLNWGVGA